MYLLQQKIISKFLIACLYIGLSTSIVIGQSLATKPNDVLIQQGAYLARIGDCTSCHTSSDDGAAPFSGGTAIPTPMGDIISSNITPAKTAAIGEYSLQDFAKAIRKGIKKDGTHLYPAMPYNAFSRLTDDDIRALYAYFKFGIAPVESKQTRQTKLSFPFNIRAFMIGWNLFYGKGASVALHDNATQQIKRGQYLVDGLGHCGACHTPRNSLMAEDAKRYLSGGIVNTLYAPNITSDKTDGIGNWSQNELVAYLRGKNVLGKGGAIGSMAQVINNSLNYISDNDLAAIVAYLKVVPAITNSKQNTTNPIHSRKSVILTEIEIGDQNNPNNLTQANFQDGAILYNNVCAACHGLNGQGTKDNFYPSLTQNTTVEMRDPRNLINAIKSGVTRNTGNHIAFMPTALFQDLDDNQVLAITNYVRNTFGNGGDTITMSDLATIGKGVPAPFIIRNAAWLFWLGTIAIIFIIIVFFRLTMRYKKQTK